MIEIDIGAKLGDFDLAAKFDAPLGTTAIFGPSGSGKTSIVRMISGLIKPDRGRIVINGEALFDHETGINLPPRQRHVGYVGQKAELFSHLNVLRNVTYSQWAGGRKSKINFDEVVDVLGMSHLLARRPVGLSGGERQRVAIARALLSDPAILLLDEPLSALDEPRKQEILPFLDAIGRNFEIPIFYISHSVDEVTRLGDHLVVLEEGSVKHAGPIGEVLGGIDLLGIGAREAGVLISGICVDGDNGDSLSSIDVGGETIVLSGCRVESGAKVRLRIRSGDVAIALEKPRATSIQNQLSCSVVSIRDEGHSHVCVLLEIGKQQLRSRITRKSALELKLKPGIKCFALLKAVALEGQLA